MLKNRCLRIKNNRFSVFYVDGVFNREQVEVYAVPKTSCFFREVK